MYISEVHEESINRFCLEGQEEVKYFKVEEAKNLDTIRVPLVLGECTVQFDVESKIRLPEPALEIKRIKKNVFLTDCRIAAGANKVFIEGLIRKNIEYASIDSVTPKFICGYIKHATVHVPFKGAAEVKHMKMVELKPDSNLREINYFDEENLGIDLKEKDFISEEHFNEKIYCELEHSSIYETTIIEDLKQIEYHPIEHEFQNFIEKEVICLTLKLLQNQQVNGDFKV